MKTNYLHLWITKTRVYPPSFLLSFWSRDQHTHQSHSPNTFGGMFEYIRGVQMYKEYVQIGIKYIEIKENVTF